MNKFFILILFLTSSLFAVIDERKSDIYYGNGIMTTKNEARASLKDVIMPTVLERIYFNDEEKMDRLHDFDLVYNYSAKEDFGDTLVAQALDLAESYEQLGNTSSAWKTNAMLLDIVQGQSKILKWPAKKVATYLVKQKGFSKAAAELLADKIVGASKATLVAMAEKLANYNSEEIHDKDLTEMVAKYTQSVKDGHGVIMVTHSQGNLFAVESKRELGAEKGWMKDYFYHVSIASPATEFASDHHWLISLDNDVVANIPYSVGTNMRNPVRYFSYYLDSVEPYMPESWVDNPELLEQTIDQINPPEGYWIDGVNPPSKSATITESMIDYTINMEPDEWDFLQADFHALDYYMGITSFQSYINEGNKVIQKSDATKDKIVYSIAAAIQAFRDAPSQWQKSAELGCGCKQRIQVEHRFDSSLNEEMKGLEVIAFDETNKLYPTGSDYVKAAAEGDSLVKYDSGDICIDLLDAKATKIDDFKGRTPVATSAQGDIEVTLSWDNGADYDLELDMPGSVRDVQSCSMEHAYVYSEFEIYPGHYPVNVTKASTGNVSGVYYVSIATPGESKVIKFDANTTGHMS